MRDLQRGIELTGVYTREIAGEAATQFRSYVDTVGPMKAGRWWDASVECRPEPGLSVGAQFILAVNKRDFDQEAVSCTITVT